MNSPAFADPVMQSQAAFRAILTAMSRPGTIVTAGERLAPPAPLAPAAAAALLALADYETPLWLSPAFAPEIGQWLAFHTDARLVNAPHRAFFALVDLETDALDLEAFALGTLPYPDRSTTIVAQARTLSPDGALSLAGPGIKGEARFDFQPRPADFAARWRANGAKFPLVVDVILAAGVRLAALPRSATIFGDG